MEVGKLRSEGWIAVGVVQKRSKTTQAGGPAFLLPGGRKEHLVHQGLRGQPGGSQLSGGGFWLGWTLMKGLPTEGLVNSVKRTLNFILRALGNHPMDSARW